MRSYDKSENLADSVFVPDCQQTSRRDTKWTSFGGLCLAKFYGRCNGFLIMTVSWLLLCRFGAAKFVAVPVNVIEPDISPPAQVPRLVR